MGWPHVWQRCPLEYRSSLAEWVGWHATQSQSACLCHVPHPSSLWLDAQLSVAPYKTQWFLWDWLSYQSLDSAHQTLKIQSQSVLTAHGLYELAECQYSKRQHWLR